MKKLIGAIAITLIIGYCGYYILDGASMLMNNYYEKRNAVVEEIFER